MSAILSQPWWMVAPELAVAYLLVSLMHGLEHLMTLCEVVHEGV